MRSTRIGWAIGTVLLICAHGAQALDVEARLQSDVLRPGESVELTLRVRGGDGSESPDLAPLERDFRVLDIARSLRSRVVNGHYDSSVDWQISLLPRRGGELEVPVLEVAGARSQPQPLHVTAARPGSDTTAAEARAGAARPAVFLEAEVDEASPYVQAEVGLRVRLYVDARVRDGALSDPVVGGAVVERVGEDRQYRERRHGADYAVVERRYALFPQRSGPLEIPPVVFEGRVREERSSRRGGRHPLQAFAGGSLFDDAFPRASLFDDFFGGSFFDGMLGGGGRPLHLEGRAISLDVRPRPDNATAAWWIPARDVELVERWEREPPVFRVGEPVERLVAIRARGISVSQLPELELPQVDGFKQYSQPLADETMNVGDEVIAVRARNSTLIPTQAGLLSLPALELEWWDTESESPRTARLPARRVEVLPARAAGATPSPPTAGPGASPGPPSALPQAPGGAFAEIAESAPPSRLAMIPRGAGVAGMLGLAAAVVGLGGWWLLRGRLARGGLQPAAAGREDPLAMSLGAAERSLRAACRAGDPVAASRALAAVAVARWPAAPPRGASDWARCSGVGALRAAVETLLRVRYSPEEGEWEGSFLWQAYKASRRRFTPTATARSRSALPELYPPREPAGASR